MVGPGAEHPPNPAIAPTGPGPPSTRGLAYFRHAQGYCVQGLPEIPVWNPNQFRHNVGTKFRRDFELDAAKAVEAMSKGADRRGMTMGSTILIGFARRWPIWKRVTYWGW